MITTENLSDKELLSEFLPNSTVDELLHEHHSIYNIIVHTTAQQLEDVQGMGEFRTKRIMALRELMNRIQQYDRSKIKIVHGPEEVFQYFRFLKDREKEELWVLLLNTKNHITGSQCISIGALDAATANPREVFNAAIKNMAAGVILVHNHPSGDSTPSREDIAVTQKMTNAGQILNIPLLDHIIIAKYGGCSLKKRGLI